MNLYYFLWKKWIYMIYLLVLLYTSPVYIQVLYGLHNFGSLLRKTIQNCRAGADEGQELIAPLPTLLVGPM